MSVCLFAKNPVSGFIFCGRRANRATEDKTAVSTISDTTVAATQSVSAARAAAAASLTGKEFSNAFGRYANAYVSAVENAAQGNGALAKAAGCLDFFSRHVNGLIGLTTGIQICCADDKTQALFDKGTALGAMLLGEHCLKNGIGGKGELIAYNMYNLINAGDNKAVKSVTKEELGEILKELPDFAKKIKRAGIAIEGLALVAASIASWNAGSKIGKFLYEKVTGKSADSEEEMLAKKDKTEKENQENEDINSPQKLLADSKERSKAAEESREKAYNEILEKENIFKKASALDA